LSLEAIEGLGERLKRFWRYYGQDSRTRTRDTRAYGLACLSGLLRLEADRNIARIGRRTGVSEQILLHFPHYGIAFRIVYQMLDIQQHLSLLPFILPHFQILDSPIEPSRNQKRYRRMSDTVCAFRQERN
jgi:hypothetical protein